MAEQLQIRDFAIAVIAFSMTIDIYGGTNSTTVGYDDLVNRIGEENMPTGDGVVVAHVEAPSGGNYGPNQGSSIYSGKTFTAMSGETGTSGHANTVGRHFYANNSETDFRSLAPGITEIYLYEASGWITTDYLNTGLGAAAPPAVSPGGAKIYNNSWIASFGPAATNNEVLRRTDFAITRDELLIVSGVNNGPGSTNLPLMSHTFNGITVGVADGDHLFADTLADIDGPGRMKPEIVAPEVFTSYSTPIVAAAAAMMSETAQSLLAGSSNAERSDVIKAVLLGGANHRVGWTNNPDTSGPFRGSTSRPLDEIYGVDVLNVNKSHLILTAGEYDGDSTIPTCPNTVPAAWDLATIEPTGSRYYRFRVFNTADEVSILATWHRNVNLTFVTWSLADFNLVLWGVDEDGNLDLLVGDDGLDDFASGNVFSNSSVDNVEHLYINGLEPGDYVLEVDRVDTLLETADVAVTWLFPENSRPGDADHDGDVDVDDLGAVFTGWGSCPTGPTCLADFDLNCVVDVDDLGTVFINWD